MVSNQHLVNSMQRYTTTLPMVLTNIVVVPEHTVSGSGAPSGGSETEEATIPGN